MNYYKRKAGVCQGVFEIFFNIYHVFLLKRSCFLCFSRYLAFYFRKMAEKNFLPDKRIMCRIHNKYFPFSAGKPFLIHDRCVRAGTYLKYAVLLRSGMRKPPIAERQTYLYDTEHRTHQTFQGSPLIPLYCFHRDCQHISPVAPVALNCTCGVQHDFSRNIAAYGC